MKEKVEVYKPRKTEEIIGRRPTKPDKKQMKKSKDKREKKIKKVKRSTTIFYWMIWLMMVAAFMILGNGSYENTDEISACILIISMIGMLILGWKNAYHRGLRETILLPVKYGLGIVLLTVVVIFPNDGDVIYRIIHSPDIQANMGIVSGLWAGSALIGVLLGSFFGLFKRDR